MINRHIQSDIAMTDIDRAQEISERY